MKLYNRNLDEIENSELSRKIQDITNNIINFLFETYGIEPQLLQNRAARLSVVERLISDKTYFVEYNEEKKELQNNNSISAFATTIKQNFDGSNWRFENGIYINDKTSFHKICHELFHFLSHKQQMTFNKNGIGYTKIGTSISGYDKQDNLCDSLLNAQGLNEGITELLTTKFDLESIPQRV